MNIHNIFLALIIISPSAFSKEKCHSAALIGTVEAVKISEVNDKRTKENMFDFQIKIRTEKVNDQTNTIEFSDSTWLNVMSNKSSTPSVIHNVSVSAFYSQHPVKITCNDQGVVNEIILGQDLNVLN